LYPQSVTMADVCGWVQGSVACLSQINVIYVVDLSG